MVQNCMVDDFAFLNLNLPINLKNGHPAVFRMGAPSRGNHTVEYHRFIKSQDANFHPNSTQRKVESSWHSSFVSTFLRLRLHSDCRGIYTQKTRTVRVQRHTVSRIQDPYISDRLSVLGK